MFVCWGCKSEAGPRTRHAPTGLKTREPASGLAAARARGDCHAPRGPQPRVGRTRVAQLPMADLSFIEDAVAFPEKEEDEEEEEEGVEWGYEEGRLATGLQSRRGPAPSPPRLPDCGSHLLCPGSPDPTRTETQLLSSLGEVQRNASRTASWRSALGDFKSCFPNLSLKPQGS